MREQGNSDFDGSSCLREEHMPQCTPCGLIWMNGRRENRERSGICAGWGFTTAMVVQPAAASFIREKVGKNKVFPQNNGAKMVCDDNHICHSICLPVQCI